jgi:hypothetical protein
VGTSPLTERRKEAIGTTTITLQGVTYPAYPSLKNTVGSSGGKKKLKTPTTGAQEIKTIMKTTTDA